MRITRGGRAAGRVMQVLVALLVLIAVAVVVRRTLFLLPVLAGGYQPQPPANPIAAQFASADEIFARYPLLTLAHILPALLFVLLGPLQFVSGIRTRFPGWHRQAGRVYIVSALVVGLTALVMSIAMPAVGGPSQAAATALFSIVFLFSLGKGVWHIWHRQVALHRRWMLRAFAIGLAVATIRPIIAVCAATSLLSGWRPQEYFGIAFWIGFTLHVAVAEAWLHRAHLQTRRSLLARA
ncbi:MAG TPA: DUF2306 domain-containing protein [Roseiflexaceae bacterium]|nr:DUF2306 domain-containing protein [Roseiflexaceae bacterium]